ncbi:hypothetical protein [Thermofilum pendens]|uniref:Uncharacterized protein n=1 Tax=Thermofilum pendens (strain DSM 2475 / Hrk 5) TaxID=368408 RepID=A1RWB2_THEPD|nr:hypothetical protein [Thermofilum pendens]ABL77492.1 hypothetical protein Tpen_0082 [Thermofilum pendens Hrk 5]
MEELVKSVKETLNMIDAGIRDKKFPEQMRIYIEQLGRNLRHFIEVIEVTGRENTIQSPISPSSRSAMFNLRKAFYATLSREIKQNKVDKERSLEEWRKVASRIIETFEKRGLTEAPSKIILTYEIKEEDGKRYIAFRDARILYFGLEGILSVSLVEQPGA